MIRPNLLDQEFLRKLEYLSLVSRRVFRGQLLAQRRTRQLGAGIEFADHREYAPGDDYRYLDWHVYARHEELLLKRFHEEEDLHVYILLDVSRSMALDDERKLWYAKQLAAALAYIALAEMDRVAVVAFAGEPVAEYPLTRGKGKVLNLLRFLQDLPSHASTTDLRRACAALVHRRSKTGVVLLISDFYDPAGFAPAVDLLRYHRHEPHLIQVYDRSEADPALRGDVELVDCESGQREQATIDEGVLNRYRAAFRRHQEQMRAYCREHGMACTQTTIDVPFDRLLLEMMRRAGIVE